MSKINLPVAELKPALTGFGKIISRRMTLPVLGALRIERTKDGWVTMTATDLDNTITMRLEEPTQGEPIAFLVPYEDLVRITKKCEKQDVLTLEITGGDKVLLRFPFGNQSGEEHLESLPVEDFPPIPRILGEAVAIPDTVRQAVHEAFACASQDSTRLILCGAYIDVSNPRCQHIVATSGRHLYSSNSFSLPLKDSLLIPEAKFLGWKEFNSDGEWRLRVQAEEKDKPAMFQISSRRWRFIGRQIQGTYPNWRQVIPDPTQFKTTITVEESNVDAFIKTVDRMPCPDNANHGIGIEVKARKMALFVHTEESPVRIEIPDGTIKGRDVTVHLNRDFLTQALGFGLREIQIIDEMSAVRFSEGGRQIIVMPIPGNAAPTPTTQSNPAPEPNGSTEPKGSAAATERSNMPANTNGNSNGHQAASEKPALETALEQVEVVRESLKAAVTSVTALAASLRNAQREQRSSEKEIQSARSALGKLQNVRI